MGATVVPLNPLSPAPELTSELATVGAKAVIVEKLSAATWSNVDRDAVPSVEIVIGVEGAAISATRTACLAALCCCCLMDMIF